MNVQNMNTWPKKIQGVQHKSFEAISSWFFVLKHPVHIIDYYDHVSNYMWPGINQHLNKQTIKEK